MSTWFNRIIQRIFDYLDVPVSSRQPDVGFTSTHVNRIDVAISSRATPAGVWAYETRTLTQTKFPFWSAIITQVQGSVNIPGNATVYVEIQPPSGETWWVEIGAIDSASTASQLRYFDYDGSTRRLHYGNYMNLSYEDVKGICISRILTNSLYASIQWRNGAGDSETGLYGYSGFKLSQPQWTPKRLVDASKPKPLKKPPTKSPPSELSDLKKYAYDMLGINPNRPDEYDLAIILEEDTPLAVDPKTNFPVERFSAYVQASVLADFIRKFKDGTADPVVTGYRKYLDKWKAEGIDFGV